MFALDEFIMLALHDHYRHVDGSQILRRIVGFGLLHQADSLNERFEIVGRCRQLSIVRRMSSITPLKNGTWLYCLSTTRVHVAGKEEHTRNPHRRFCSENQSNARPIAPAH